ncbi:hypothetical protein D3C85_1393260 [compost metagenome]
MVRARGQAAEHLVTVDQFLFDIQYPAQRLACSAVVFHFDITPGQGFADPVVLGKGAGGALKVGDRAGSGRLIFGACQAHAVLGAVARLLRCQAHGFGEPGGALLQVARLRCGYRCGVVTIGAGLLLEDLALVVHGILLLEFALGDGGA